MLKVLLVIIGAAYTFSYWNVYDEKNRRLAGQRRVKKKSRELSLWIL